MITVWVLVGLVIAAVALIVIYFSGSREMLAVKISGIWTNPDQTIRIVLYEVNSIFQAEIIWAGEGLEKLMGKSIVKDLRLSSYNKGEGVYLCPFTQKAFLLRLQMFDDGILKFQFKSRNGKVSRSEKWKQVMA